MTIKQIKERLSIQTVLAHYDLAADRNHMLRCPFHEDESASMRVYAETNTVYCFAGSCRVSNLDAIDFVMEMDGSSKHAAIKKCEGLLVDQGEVVKPIITKPAPLAVDEAFNRYLKAFANHKKAREYAFVRALTGPMLEIGYKSRKAAGKWGRGCLIFPLKNESGDVVSLYGRSLYATGSTGKHYYQSGRGGLYPGYPSADTELLILTESVIDAASLLSMELEVGVLALYGTNGLTVAHEQAIKALPKLAEIVLALDADAAGRDATGLIGKVLAKTFPRITLSQLILPEGEDVNSVAMATANRRAHFEQLLLERQPVNTGEVEVEASSTFTVSTPELDTSNPHDLGFVTSLASYRVKGGVQTALKHLDSLKVTLAIESAGRISRRRLNLYEDREVVACARAVGERLSLRSDLVEVDLAQLTKLLESHREDLRTHLGGPSTTKVSVPSGQREACLAFWRSENLLQVINERIGRAGIVGEENSRLLLFVVASSFAMPVTLHALIQGGSGSGKTRLLKVISELMPEERVKRYTRVTDGSLYNQGEYYFQHKLVCFEDIDGLKEEALLAVRELQSNDILVTSTSFKDESGSIRGGERTVRGPIATLACTTRAEVYEDNVSRCFVVAVDESREQSLRVIRYQNDRSAGVIDGKCEHQTKAFLQNCLRLLQPLEVVNPYANRIHLPEDAHKIRRLNELYQSFVRQITLLHQYQRQRDEQGRLITTVADLRAACAILFESIVLKVDELDGSLRQFFERLKTYVADKSPTYEFNRFEVRQATGVSKTRQHHYVHQLLELEYLKQYGFANRGYRYRIAHWDDAAALRAQLRQHLDEQLAQLEAEHPRTPAGTPG